MGKKSTKNEFIEKANKVHNYKYDYDNVEYINSRTKVSITCRKHGDFEQLPSSHLQGNGCPICATIWTDEHKKNLQISSRKSRGMTTKQWIERARLVHGDKYDYSQTKYINQRTNVKIICPKHGLFEQKADSHIRGNGCRLCGLESENHIGVHSWSNEQRKAIEKTCIERYGAKRYLDSKQGKQHILKIKSTPEFREKMSRKISSHEVQQKIWESFKKNKSCPISKPENDAYQLLSDMFGKNNVIRQYKDTRYPYHCDFYIPIFDLFIELNGTWTHGIHWFDETNPDDLREIQKWKYKAYIEHSAYYKSAIETWTVRDIKKRDIAIKNKLNYLVFWKSDLSDFKEWLYSDTLILNNID